MAIHRVPTYTVRRLRADGTIDEMRMPTGFTATEVALRFHHSDIFVRARGDRQWFWCYPSRRGTWEFLPCPEPISDAQIGQWVIEHGITHPDHERNGHVAISHG